METIEANYLDEETLRIKSSCNNRDTTLHKLVRVVKEELDIGGSVMVTIKGTIEVALVEQVFYWNEIVAQEYFADVITENAFFFGLFDRIQQL